jgi:hypothetical protein
VLTGGPEERARELAGELNPALQQLGGLRVGNERRQVFRPQGEIAARQVVGIVHFADYTATRRHAPSPRRVPRAIDEAKRRNRCIVAKQHFLCGGTPGA